MFIHNYIYRLKCIVRDKQMLFWTLLFPIVLATLFNLAVSNLSIAEKFTKIDIGIINDAQYNKNTDFIKAISAVSSSNKNGSKNTLFQVTYTSKEHADKLLQDSKLEGYIYFDNGLKLVVKESGLNQTIIKGFLDDFKQSSSTIVTVLSSNPNATTGLLQDISSRKDYLKEVSVSKAAPDTTVNYFYSLIGMACLYGSFWGLKEVVAIQANLSPQGARVNMAPTHKLKVFAISILAAASVQLLEIFVLLVYLIFIIKVNFGAQIGYVSLTCVIGTITGVTFGACIASIIKKGEGIKIGILIGFTMMMSFLSGMMFENMKYIISTYCPILGYLNPVNLITDALYSLYYYNTHAHFFNDLICLCAFIALFSTITYLVLRRQKYASL
ncbi:MAG TPA: ABC transporter permease [Clostridiaceae bacterium]